MLIINKMLRNQRGYSFVMWVAVFAVVLAGVVMFVVPVKRAITAKTLQTTDLALWGVWGDDVQQDGGWNENQIGAMVTTTGQNISHKRLENRGKVRVILNADSDTTSSYSSY